MSQNSNPLDQVDQFSDHYCMTCYEVVPIGQIEEHREEKHDGSMMPDIEKIHEESEGLIAQKDSMGHYSPHTWMEVDDHQMCGECGATVVKPEDVPADSTDESDGDV